MGWEDITKKALREKGTSWEDEKREVCGFSCSLKEFTNHGLKIYFSKFYTSLYLWYSKMQPGK